MAYPEKTVPYKPFLIIFVGTFALLVLSSIVGNVLESSGAIGKLSPRQITYVKVFYFALFCVLGFSLVPLVVRLVISMQTRIGNADLVIIRLLQSHEKGIVYSFWALFVIGLSIAVPYAIKDGFFK